VLRPGCSSTRKSWPTRDASPRSIRDDEECARSIPLAVEKTVHDFVEMYGAMNPPAD
jgi:hypothetical protein